MFIASHTFGTRSHSKSFGSRINEQGASLADLPWNSLSQGSAKPQVTELQGCPDIAPLILQLLHLMVASGAR